MGGIPGERGVRGGRNGGGGGGGGEGGGSIGGAAGVQRGGGARKGGGGDGVGGGGNPNIVEPSGFGGLGDAKCDGVDVMGSIRIAPAAKEALAGSKARVSSTMSSTHAARLQALRKSCCSSHLTAKLG